MCDSKNICAWIWFSSFKKFDIKLVLFPNSSLFRRCYHTPWKKTCLMIERGNFSTAFSLINYVRLCVCGSLFWRFMMATMPFMCGVIFKKYHEGYSSVRKIFFHTHITATSFIYGKWKFEIVSSFWLAKATGGNKMCDQKICFSPQTPTLWICKFLYIFWHSFHVIKVTK